MEIKIKYFKKDDQKYTIRDNELKLKFKKIKLGTTWRCKSYREGSQFYQLTRCNILVFSNGCKIPVYHIKKWIETLDKTDGINLIIYSDKIAVECDGSRAEFLYLTDSFINAEKIKLLDAYDIVFVPGK